jgi:uncharacterized protein YegJ (DUF2314 family)
MTTIALIVASGLFALMAWWWFIARNRPSFPPLVIADDDPLMLEAHRKARESIPRLLELFEGAREATRVKLPFVSSSGETEHLWAELLKVDGQAIDVRYVTPPVTHSGRLERLHTHSIADIEDWIVTRDPDHYIGGYSMRVMFRRGREQWGELPPELAAEESKYREA